LHFAELPQLHHLVQLRVHPASCRYHILKYHFLVFFKHVEISQLLLLILGGTRK